MKQTATVVHREDTIKILYCMLICRLDQARRSVDNYIKYLTFLLDIKSNAQ